MTRLLHRIIHGPRRTLVVYQEPQKWRPRELTVRDEACPGCRKLWCARYWGPVRLGGWFVLIDDIIGEAAAIRKHRRQAAAYPSEVRA